MKKPAGTTGEIPPFEFENWAVIALGGAWPGRLGVRMGKRREGSIGSLTDLE